MSNRNYEKDAVYIDIPQLAAAPFNETTPLIAKDGNNHIEDVFNISELVLEIASRLSSYKDVTNLSRTNKRINFFISKANVEIEDQNSETKKGIYKELHPQLLANDLAIINIQTINQELKEIKKSCGVKLIRKHKCLLSSGLIVGGNVAMIGSGYASYAMSNSIKLAFGVGGGTALGLTLALFVILIKTGAFGEAKADHLEYLQENTPAQSPLKFTVKI